MSTFKENPWAAKILGVELRDADTGDKIGRTDVINLGDGIDAQWDATEQELTISANAGFQIVETAADVSVVTTGGDTTILDYDLSAISFDGVDIVDGQSLLIDVRVEAWRPGASIDVAGYCDFTSHVIYHAAGSTFRNDPTIEQVTSSSWEAGLSADATIASNTIFRVYLNTTLTNVRAACLLSHRAPRTRSAS